MLLTKLKLKKKKVPKKTIIKWEKIMSYLHFATNQNKISEINYLLSYSYSLFSHKIIKIFPSFFKILWHSLRRGNKKSSAYSLMDPNLSLNCPKFRPVLYGGSRYIKLQKFSGKPLNISRQSPTMKRSLIIFSLLHIDIRTSRAA